jgi:predicted MFS family arabinose efflux permease
MSWWDKAVDWGTAWLGGRGRAQVIGLLAMALGLAGADLGAVGAMSLILQHEFGINKAQVGTLIAASQGTGVFSTLLFGWLVDRTKRTRVLAIALGLWAIAMIA